MKAYIVSLDKPQHLIDTFVGKGFIVEVLGVDGKKLSAGEYFSWIAKRSDKFMTPGEVGCALSHKKIYEKMMGVNDEDYHLILEDDVTIKEHFFQALGEINKEKYDIVILGGQDENPDRFYLWGEVDSSGVTRISPFFSRRIWSTCAYIINKKAAASILMRQKEKLNRADSWAEWCPSLNLRMGFINIVDHPSDRSKSLIENERRLIDKYKRLRNSALVGVVRFFRFCYFAAYGIATGKSRVFKFKARE